MKKKFFSTLLCFVMLFSIAALPVQAVNEASTATPRWVNCASISLTLDQSGNTVSWSGSIYGHSGTIKITACYTLEKLDSNGSYVLVGTWDNLSTTTRTYLNSSGSAIGAAGTYRLSLTGTVQSATYSEQISAVSTQTFS